MIPLFKVFIPDEASEAVVRTLKSGYVTQGPRVEEFEYLLRGFLDVAHVLTVNSATSGLQLACHLAGLGPGTYAISTPMTCTATNTAILSTGASILWADVDPNTGNITPESIAQVLAQHRNTKVIKAVMCVDWAGLPCDYDAIFGVTSERGVKIIRDAAHAWGAKYRESLVPSEVDYTVYSFQAIKHLTTVDGGVLVCASNADHNRGKKLRWYGIDRDLPKQDMRCEMDVVEPGWKYHMNDWNATLGITQMAHTEKIIEAHIDNGTFYDDWFTIYSAIDVPVNYVNLNHYQPSYWIYTILLDDPEGLKIHLADNHIQASKVHSPNHTHTMLTHVEDKDAVPGVELFYARQLNIPCGWWVTKDDRVNIATAVNEFVRR